MRIAIISACGSAASLLAGFALPIIYPQVPHSVAICLLAIAAALLIVAGLLQLWARRTNGNSQQSGPPAATSYKQEHSGKGDNIINF